MDELIEVMKDVLIELQEINSKLDEIRGSGTKSIDDLCSELESISSDIFGIELNTSNIATDVSGISSAI